MPRSRRIWCLCAAAALVACRTTREENARTIQPAPRRDFRAAPPVVPQAPELELPNFLDARADNGMRILVSEQHAWPVVSVNLAFAAGSAADPDSRAGLASLTYDLLLEGAGETDAAGLDAAFGMLGTTPAVHTEPDGAVLGVTVLTEHTAGALRLLASVVRHPSLAQSGFELRKAQQLADLAALSSSPSFVAQRAFLDAAYGPSHPYGHTPAGSVQSVQQMTLPDAREFYVRHVGPETVAVVLTGDITLARAVEAVNAAFGDWHAPAHREPPPPPVDSKTSTPIVTVARGDLNQTTLWVGRPALAAGDPQEAPLEIATAIMGGLFSSRLNLNLREIHGYAYGAKADLTPRRGIGPWFAYAAVRADATAAALDEMMTELGNLPVQPFTEAETEAGRRSLVASLPGQFETADELAGALARIYWYDEPLDRYAQLVAELRSTTASDVEEVGLRYLRPESLSIVAVGDPRVLRTQLPRVQLNPARATTGWAGR